MVMSTNNMAKCIFSYVVDFDTSFDKGVLCWDILVFTEVNCDGHRIISTAISIFERAFNFVFIL